MLEDGPLSEKIDARNYLEIEKIKNGFIVHTVRGKVHARTFNGLVRILAALFHEKFIIDKEYANTNK